MSAVCSGMCMDRRGCVVWVMYVQVGACIDVEMLSECCMFRYVHG